MYLVIGAPLQWTGSENWTVRERFEVTWRVMSVGTPGRSERVCVWGGWVCVGVGVGVWVGV